MVVWSSLAEPAAAGAAAAASQEEEDEDDEQSGNWECYVFLVAAMDKLIGRVVAGLPVDSHTFAALPSHFQQGTDQVMLDRLLRRQFGTLGRRFRFA